MTKLEVHLIEYIEYLENYIIDITNTNLKSNLYKEFVISQILEEKEKK